MDYRIIIGIPLGLIVLFLGIFRINSKKQLLPKILFIFIGICTEFIFLGKILKINPEMILYAGLGFIVVLFIILSMIMWKERKSPKMKTFVKFYFVALGLIVLYIIVLVILAQVGVLHFGK